MGRQGSGCDMPTIDYLFVRRVRQEGNHHAKKERAR
jgi:hypothetical protein